MSAEIEAATDLKVKYSRRLHKDGRDEEQSEVEMLDDGEQHSDLGVQKSEKHNQKNLQAGKRCHFRVFQSSLGVLYLLILAGFILRSTLKINRLQAELSVMRVNSSQLQDEVKTLKDKIKGNWCPDGWTRFGLSCYFKFTEWKTWSDSRKLCQKRGADLVIINSKEEQEFVHKLNGNGESWIGLQVSGGEWKWVDGSPLTEHPSINPSIIYRFSGGQVAGAAA
ncbi:CD209 antigen-like protein A isoform 2-T2 [Odontesthes bonariensis]|uniref:CD209 antigen-like protein A isoform X2 n=1 Tax=Odontesthes bonariensis TaxID=219752 RepID=UPI003F5874AE